MSSSFAFHHRWTLPVPPAVVLDRLLDLQDYPRWWPQVRRVERVDDDTSRVLVRALLPVPLHLVLAREAVDRAGGRLRVGLAGDLEGYAAVRVVPAPAGSLLAWDQEVRVVQPVLRRMTGPAPGRWALRANHAGMMRSALRGLSR